MIYKYWIYQVTFIFWFHGDKTKWKLMLFQNIHGFIQKRGEYLRVINIIFWIRPIVLDKIRIAYYISGWQHDIYFDTIFGTLCKTFSITFLKTKSIMAGLNMLISCVKVIWIIVK
jgi:hypothetical protein